MKLDNALFLWLYLYLVELNCFRRMRRYFFACITHSAKYLIVLRHVSATVEPPDTTVDINHETQPSAVREEEGGGSTVRSGMEEFLSLKLRPLIKIASENTYGHVPSCPGQCDSICKCSQGLGRGSMR